MMHLLIALKRRGFKFPKYVLWQIIGWAKKVFDFTPEVARFLRPKMSPTYIAVGGILRAIHASLCLPNCRQKLFPNTRAKSLRRIFLN